LRLLRSWSVVHVKKSMNAVAHNIARYAILCFINRVWIEKTPNCICNIVGRDIHVPSYNLIFFLIKILTFFFKKKKKKKKRLGQNIKEICLDNNKKIK
jgi:hypothetical protein